MRKKSSNKERGRKERKKKRVVEVRPHDGYRRGVIMFCLITPVLESKGLVLLPGYRFTALTFDENNIINFYIINAFPYQLCNNTRFYFDWHHISLSKLEKENNNNKQR